MFLMRKLFWAILLCLGAGLPTSAAELFIPLSGKEVAAAFASPLEIGGKGVSFPYSHQQVQSCGIPNSQLLCLVVGIGKGPPLSLTLHPTSGRLKINGTSVRHDLKFWAPSLLAKGVDPGDGQIAPFGKNFILVGANGKSVAVIGR